MQRKRQKGSPTTVKLLPKISEDIFQQDGAPAHSAARTAVVPRSFSVFWEQGDEQGAGENLCGIMRDELSKTEPATSEDGLVGSLWMVWLSISVETRDNSVCRMPEQMR